MDERVGQKGRIFSINPETHNVSIHFFSKGPTQYYYPDFVLKRVLE